VIQAVDLFCGAGGTSSGILKACDERLRMPIHLTAVNHWQTAINTHTLNHPRVNHICEPVENIHPLDLVKSGKLNLLAASCECRFHSNARGGGPCNEQSRSQPWQLIRWATDITVENILMENVREFQNWGPLHSRTKRPIKSRKGEYFKSFINALMAVYKYVEWHVQICADYGDATTRPRLILMARNTPIAWPDPTHGAGRANPWRTVRQCIEWNMKGESIFSRKTHKLSANTLRKIEIGIEQFTGSPFILNLSHGEVTSLRSVNEPLFTLTTAKGGELALCEPFLLKYYGTGKPMSVDGPLHTLTVKPRFGLVEFTKDGGDILFRMLRVREMARCHSFPESYQFTGTIADQTKQIGNSVPVELACAHAEAVLR
jgi:DNA (cytosine-5)-methyltransferase 1